MRSFSKWPATTFPSNFPHHTSTGRTELCCWFVAYLCYYREQYTRHGLEASPRPATTPHRRSRSANLLLWRSYFGLTNFNFLPFYFSCAAVFLFFFFCIPFLCTFPACLLACFAHLLLTTKTGNYFTLFQTSESLITLFTTTTTAAARSARSVCVRLRLPNCTLTHTNTRYYYTQD